MCPSSGLDVILSQGINEFCCLVYRMSPMLSKLRITMADISSQLTSMVKTFRYVHIFRAVARTLIGGCIFIYSSSARLTSFEINFISKEISRAEPEYMNIHPPISALATALHILLVVL